MSDPSFDLQCAVNQRLRAVVPAVASRVFDEVPQDVAFPYVEIGNGQTVDDGAQCHDGVEVFLDLHVWSRAAGQPEAKTIAGAVRGALHEAELDLGASWQFLEIAHQDTRYLKDPDGRTSHAVLTFRALIAAR